MNCPSNPRELAFKRNYRYATKGIFLLLVFAIFPSNASSFMPQNQAAVLPMKNTSSKTFLQLVPQKNTSVKSNDVAVMDLSSTTLSTQDTRAGPLDSIFDFCAQRSPGVCLSVALAQLSIAVGKTALGTHVSPLLWATILGMLYGNLVHKRDPTIQRALANGIKFSKGRLLRAGIILYGFKITLQQIAGIGIAGLMTDVFMVSSTLGLGMWLGQKLGLDKATSTLIGSGAAICGCSAVLATQPVVGGESHQVSAAVGTVVLGGTLSMFLYPMLYKMVPLLAANAKLMGIYTGSTIHEIAGVVAAGNAMGPDVAFTAVVTKLARVLLLAPVLTGLSYLQNRHCLAQERKDCKLMLPWFAFGFVGVSALNSLAIFPKPLIALAGKASAFCLLCAMAALGVESDLSEIRKLGSKPIILASTLWAWLAIGGLGVSRFFLGV